MPAQHKVASPLLQQSDGMRAFVTLLLELLHPTIPMLLIDEAEAFLHPAQAMALGKIIAERNNQGQLFIATHSFDLLQGLVNVPPDRLHVLRMRRENETDLTVNRISRMDKECMQKIIKDPLINYSQVMSGVFHERAIICEADSDCLFYKSLFNLHKVCGKQQPDILFMHAGGKHRMGHLAQALKSSGTQVDIIADIDILQKDQSLQNIIGAKNLSKIKDLVQRIRSAIDRTPIQLDQIESKIQHVMKKENFSIESIKEIKSILKETSNWETLKRFGKSSLPSGEITKDYENLEKYCKSLGLWIVPVGQLESFCKQCSGHGPRWVQSVFEDYNADSAELEGACQFVSEIWLSQRNSL